MTEATPELEALLKAMQTTCRKSRRAQNDYDKTVQAVMVLRYFFSEDEDITDTDRLIIQAMEGLEPLQQRLLAKSAKAQKKSDAAHEAYWKAYRAHLSQQKETSNDNV